jgi:hypothetical protein
MCANTNSPVVNLRDNRKQKNPEKNKRMKELERLEEDTKKKNLLLEGASGVVAMREPLSPL